MSTVSGIVADVRALADRAQALERSCEELAGASTDDARRATLSRVADRLGASVLRPLRAGTAEQGAADAAAQQDAGERAGADSEEAVARELHELALEATGLRLRAGGSLALQEALAALQDLACQTVAADADQLAAARSEFAKLLSALPPTIQSASNGPYLLTNAGDLVDWLGVQLDATPQSALCRCGASALKPLCDGSHAQIGFVDGKAEDRVPDRLDTYHGMHVTIGDNRGTCAHSGFCTDRLPDVFRSDQEPFVAPAGGRVDEILRAAGDCPSGALSATNEGQDPVGHSDQTRQAHVEVSLDGPYRVSGGVALLAHDGSPEPRNEGASLEHFSLCRCGKSQNKPFCSGMHWYADFHDPAPPEQATLFEWAGGFPALLRLTRRFYERHIPEDPLLAGLFSQMAPDHPERVAAWLGQVFGGPPAYSDSYGNYDRMISQHLDRRLTPQQRAHWVMLLCRSADEVGLPNDAEFRAAFTAYLEWGSRIAVENSQEGVEPPPHMPVPRWWWVCDAYPWSRSRAHPQEVAEEPAPELPGPDVELSFEAHIKPLFRGRDRESMSFVFDLASYADVSKHSGPILERLRAGTMPCDGAWPAERIDVLERWISSGMAQ